MSLDVVSLAREGGVVCSRLAKVDCSHIQRKKMVDTESAIQPGESKEDLIARLSALEQKWYVNGGVMASINSICDMFGVEDGNSSFQSDNVNKAHARIQSYMHTLKNGLERHGIFHFNDTRTMFTKIAQVEKSSYLTLMLLIHTRMASQSLYTEDANPSRIPFCQTIKDQMKDEVVNDMKPNQLRKRKLKEFVLDSCFENKLMRSGSMIAKPIMVTRKDGATFFTSTYKNDCDIEVFIERVIEGHSEMVNIMDEPGNPQWLTGRLKNVIDYRLRDLEKDRHLFAFNDGLYFAAKDTFVKYENSHKLAEMGMKAGMVAARFHDMPFETDATRRRRMCVDSDPMDEPTPVTDQLFIDQGFGMDTIRWVYILFGRMIYDLGEKDNWQVQLFLHGLGGTGKSTIAKLLSLMYATEDIGPVMNEVEQAFPVTLIYDKFFYIAWDIGTDFSMSKYLWQNIVCGDEIAMYQKFKDAVKLMVRGHGMMIGNEFPDMMKNDPSESVGRRMVIMSFMERISKKNTGMMAALTKEWPILLRKINALYLSEVATNGNEDIWNIIDKYFVMMKEDVSCRMNPLKAFLHCKKMVCINPKHIEIYKCSLRSLNRKFKVYCKQNNATFTSLVGDESLYSNAIQAAGLKAEDRTEKGEKPVANVNGEITVPTEKWILGLRVIGEIPESSDMDMGGGERKELPQHAYGQNQKAQYHQQDRPWLDNTSMSSTECLAR